MSGLPRLLLVVGGVLSFTALPRVAQPCSAPDGWFRSLLPEGEGMPTDVRPRLATNYLGTADVLLEVADGRGVPTTAERVPYPAPTIGPAEFMPANRWIVLVPVAPLAPHTRYRLRVLPEEPLPASGGEGRAVEFVTGDGPAQTPVPAAVLNDLRVRQSAPHRCDGGSSVVGTVDVQPPPPFPGTLLMRVLVGPPAAVVKYFEIIKEKWPAAEIPFDKIVKVGRAYHEMGEYERSYLIFRATVEGSFMRESGVAGFLQSQGEFLRSVEVMGRLLREYPPEGYIASATYALAQRVYAKAPEAADDENLRKQKVNRVDLIRRAWAMLETFLTAYPDDPAADQAAFSTANALLELKAYDQATAACNRYAKRYPKSDMLDSYWYIIGYCHFATGEHESALSMCPDTRISSGTWWPV